MNPIPTGVLSQHPLHVEIRLTRTYRILIPWNDGHRQLLWFRVAKDLSISLATGERVTAVDLASRRRASSEPLPAKLQSRLGHIPTGPDFHMTFHTSGVVNAPGLPRTYRKSYTAPGVHEFCAIDFKHPDRLRSVKPRQNDIIAPWLIQPDSALRGIMMATPGDVVGFFHEPPLQMPLVLRLPPDGPAANLFLQFSLLQQPGPWPDDTTVISVTQDPESLGLGNE